MSAIPAAAPPRAPGPLARFLAGDVWHSFRSSPMPIGAAAVALACIFCALIAGVGRALFPNAHDSLAFGVLILAIALPGWVQYARTVRGSTMVERNKEYVQAARVVGVPPMRIMLRHVLPNVLGPVLVLATIHVATAIQTEATLSFLGVGVSPTSPSLGTFINEGNKQLFSGAWWLVIFPGSMLLLIALSMNLFGDWLRDALNPRLR